MRIKSLKFAIFGWELVWMGSSWDPRSSHPRGNLLYYANYIYSYSSLLSVVRLQGSLRVIVNTKLWPDMLLERVSQKRLRMSGTVEDSVLTTNESEQVPAISIYLVSVSTFMCY